MQRRRARLLVLLGLLIVVAVPVGATLAAGGPAVSAGDVLSCQGLNESGLDMSVRTDGALVVRNPTNASVPFRVHKLTGEAYHVIAPGRVQAMGGYSAVADFAAEAPVPRVPPGETLIVARKAMGFPYLPDPLPGVHLQRVTVNGDWACAVQGVVVPPWQAWDAWAQVFRERAQHYLLES